MSLILLLLSIIIYFILIYTIEKKYTFEQSLIIKIALFSLLIPIFKIPFYSETPYSLYYIFIIYGIVLILLPEKWIKTSGFRLYINKKRLFLIPLSASITEEVFFRGILNELLLNVYNSIIIVSIISSFLFALIHIFNFINGIENKKYFLLTFPLRFAFGLFFSYIYFKYGLFSVIIIHFLVDFPALYRLYKLNF
ncbi:hypothetical protein SAMN02745164_01350 [Marinitoga hydrogenitolerans DSM 16785]|uniref:CAAX prenyl protease 2/Lysostaphin resistance protein A-like domain-containing protein n=1 Tax=Marinitoga hydrogenitolerans (strain DSM 16785 / JCM 12826 / AT1271) TaxID=1122195 RepID=A0A1M4X6F0_MARH1|nr:CPBP family intramembrane glutamic endopeptidase [Marinitoga hydrogenitolerans]SHE89025.1 hypothetical protein SAMN02745164_01350 [Marinitoga hydrogenitolerans DSM 16785]